MKETSAKTKMIKRIMGIAVPALIIVITIIMVSVSFAWFSQEVVPSVSTIRLTVDKSFTLTFTAGADSGTRNINYKGQTAIDSNSRLVTESNGRVHSSLGGAGLQQYMLDAPYYFITTIALDTESTDVDMTMALDACRISIGKTVLDSYDAVDGAYPSSDMPYAFTWYFKEHDANSVNYTGSVVDGDDRRVMDYRLPEEGEVWYTPYGKLTFDANHLISAINDKTDGIDSYSILDGDITDMLLNAHNTNFDFYIVFAPQKLFWAQFCNADKDKTANDIYTAEERVKIYGQSSENMMYYSNTKYFGATFEFGATLSVEMHSAE